MNSDPPAPLSEKYETLYADVALNLPLDTIYQYSVPEEMKASLRCGNLVRVPIRNRSADGCILGLSHEKKCRSPRPINRILTPGFHIPQELIDLALWISDYYLCSPGEALHCVSFIGFNDCRHKSEKWVFLVVEKEPPVLPPRQSEVWDLLGKKPGKRMKYRDLLDTLGVSPSVVQGLFSKGLVRFEDSIVDRKDGYPGDPLQLDPHVLNDHQSSSFEKIRGAIREDRYETFLLCGVTGSGKTEIYLQALESVFHKGRQGIVLVPEIALTPQTVERFRGRFGERIGVYHSHLSLGQKYDMWRGIREGRIQALVGARSAVFAPFPKLGLIVVDEEHESTYKQNETPRYHARDVAVMRASRLGATVILGSATPSLEAFHNAQTGKFTLLTLPERIRKTSLPSVTLVDMGKEMEEKKTIGIFSRELESGIRRRLDRGEQVILFLNRRGFANFLMCPSCNRAIQCEHCDVTMTYHKVGQRLMCHYCGMTKKIPEECPHCGKKGLMALGIGTQRLEDELEAKFPGARILRLDSDTLGSRGAFLKKWKAITSGDVDILFGTQILAKGFDLAPVTLVGVISADNSLFLPDFRSAERTFSLLTQVSGRSGRGDKPGEVIIQTFLPKHYSIVDALAQDYAIFAKREFKNRKALRFPPFYRLLSVLFQGKDKNLTRERIRRFGNILRVLRNRLRLKSVSILGPAPSPIGKLGDRYRFRLLLRAEKTGDLKRILKAGMEKYHSLKLKGPCRITIDVDPQDLL